MTEPSPPESAQPQPWRKVGILLGIGIFLIPIVFAWFTLRQGHSTVARVVSFAWLVLTLIAYGSATYGPDQDPQLAASIATASA